MPKTIIGVVSSISGSKTIAIKVEQRKTHPILRKQFLDTKKFLVHDEKNEAVVGDKVSAIECRPISAKKHFKLEKIILKAKLSQESLSALKSDDVDKSSKSKSSKTEEAAASSKSKDK